MRSDWIEDLLALLDTKGVADAARKRNVTQPTFSRRIQMLEDALGFDVIDRSVKPSGPSPIVLEHEAELRKLSRDMRGLVDAMRHTHSSGTRQLVIASQHAITTSLGPEIIKRLAEPGRTHIRLRSANLDECDTLLVTRQAALSLTYHIRSENAADLPSFLTQAVIGQETLIPVCSADHAPVLAAHLERGELRMIGYPSDVFLGAALARYILPTLRQSCEISVITETALSTAALQLAQSGLGIAWIPDALARPALTRGELVDLSATLGSIDMNLIARRWTVTSNAATLDAWRKLTGAKGHA